MNSLLNIDIHTHGIAGYDTNTDSPDDILRIAEIQGQLGISEIILTLYPAEIDIMRRRMSIIKKAIEFQEEVLRSELDVLGNLSKSKWARIIGVHLEGPFLNKKRCGALNQKYFLEPSEYFLMLLLEGFEDLVKIITIAPELEDAAKVIKKITDMGIVASMGHSDATFNEALEGYNSGAKGITHIFNAMRGFHHREPGIAGFALINKHVYIEVIADPYHLHPATLEMILKVKNHERIIIVSDSVKETRLSSSLESITGASGKLLGGSIPIKETAKMLIEKGFDEEIIIKSITENPRRYLSL